MVDGQVRTEDVTDLRLLDALSEIPRERFVPAELAELAYLDRNLAVDTTGGVKRYLLKPAVLAKMIQAADIRDTDRVLDVACATGYSTAVLSRLAESVIGLEEDEALARRADATLRALGIANASVRHGALAEGLAPLAPFDVILIGGTVEVVPDALQAQLKDGGRLVCIQRQGRGPVARATVYRASSGDVSGYSVFDAAAPLLPAFVRPPQFVF